MLITSLLKNNIIKRPSIIILRTLTTNTSTLDESEVKHFEAFSSSWWDEAGEMKPLHSLNKIRVPFVREQILNSNFEKINSQRNSPEPLKGFKLLDVGCGGGLLCEPLARLGAEMTGIDASKDLIEMAKRHSKKDHKLKTLSYKYSTIEEFSNSDENKCSFDGVIASEIIEHVCDQSRFVGECVRCLKPGGSIFFTTINKTLMAKILAISIIEDLLRVIPQGTHDYEKFMEPHVLQRILEENDCQMKLIHGMFYNYFTNSWSWISDTSICYAVHAIKH